MSNSYTAALMAGGESKRMGADKATLLVDGEPLWSKQLSLLYLLDVEEVVISSAFKKEWIPENVKVILDQHQACGPLAGLAALLDYIETTHLIVLAVDLPKMSTAYLKTLMDQTLGAKSVVPEWRGFYQPLSAIYARESKQMAMDCLQLEDHSLQNFVRCLNKQDAVVIDQVPLDYEEVFTNWNTPNDYQ